MFRATPLSRSTGNVLRDKTGASIADGLAGIALVLIALGVLGAGLASNISAVNVVATKAEREAVLTGVVGEKRGSVTWGTAAAPRTQTVTTPTGRPVQLTTWREVTGVSTRLVAAAPVSADADAADCSGPASVAKDGCLYASRLHANTLDEIDPHALLRKHAGMGSTPVVGDVNAKVGTTTPIAQGDQVATTRDTAAKVWRYLIEANAAGTSGEITFLQGSKVLAVIPVESSTHNYFGTLTTELNVPVKAVVTSGSVVVSTVFVYRAGGTS